MSEYIEQRLLVGNCLDTLKRLADDSIDSIVTDPPYELGFMGKSWDNSGVAYQVSLWQECLRVLKPGGHILAFGGTRTYHRMSVAIEDAGFEIRDSIHWTYGSGFPKSMSVSKAVESHLLNGKSNPIALRKTEQEGDGESYQLTGKNNGILGETRVYDRKEFTPSTDQAKQWQGWGTALKPSHEPIVLARKPLIGTVAENVLQYKTGGINIDATRIGTDTLGGGTMPDLRDVGAMSKEATGIDKLSFGQNPRPAERLEQPTYTGRFPANTLLTHNHDCQVIQEGYISDTKTPDEVSGGIWKKGTGDGKPAGNTYTDVPAMYTCTPNCPVATLNQQSGITKSSARVGHPGGSTFGGSEMGENVIGTWFGDTGGASRFFHNSQWQPADDITPFIYQAKPSKKERNAGLDNLKMIQTVGGGGLTAPLRDDGTLETSSAGGKYGSIKAVRQNFHPTVKPIELMRYLIKLITPPKGTVLDPFLGSGTTAVAAILDGFEWKGCEMTEDYLPIIKGRVAWARKEAKEKAKQ